MEEGREKGREGWREGGRGMEGRRDEGREREGRREYMYMKNLVMVLCKQSAGPTQCDVHVYIQSHVTTSFTTYKSASSFYTHCYTPSHPHTHTPTSVPMKVGRM